MSISEHLTSCGAWTGHSCTCWLDRHPEVADDPKDTRIAKLESMLDKLETWDGYGWIDGEYEDSFGKYLKRLRQHERVGRKT